MASLHQIPAVILPASARSGLEVHFFPRILPHVTDIEVTCRAVEREPLRVREARWKGQTQQPALHAAAHALADVEEGPRERAPIAHDANQPCLVRHEQPAAAIPGMRYFSWARSPVREGNQPQRRPFD